MKNRILPASMVLVVAVSGAAYFFLSRPSVPDFSTHQAGEDRKQAFFSFFLPLVEQRNQEILEMRRKLLAWNSERDSIHWWETWEIQDIAAEYRLDEFDIDSDSDWDTLLKRVDVVPPSMALAQAANESAWGTSRFAREANNFYGHWCFKVGCGIVPKHRADGLKHEVAKFDSPRESVQKYIHNLNSHNAYTYLRNLRSRLRENDKPLTGFALIDGLGSYSERGINYIKELRSMIIHNDLSRYDIELTPGQGTTVSNT